MSKIIITDKTVEGAIKKAVDQLEVNSKDDLNITVLENAVKGFLGFGSKSAKIEAEIKEKDIDIDLTFNFSLDEEEHNEVIESKEILNLEKDNNDLINPEKLAKDFLSKILLAMDIQANIEVKKIDKTLDINIKSDKDNVLIGKRGKTLESLEFLTNLAVNKGENKYINIYIDVANYKERRKKTLEQLATNLSKKVYKTKRRHVLEPMSRYERKIIHNVLHDSPYVKTHSEGSEPNRYIVIDVR